MSDFAVGVQFGATDSALVRLRVADSWYQGVLIAGSSNTRVEQSRVSRNGRTTDQAGLVVVDSPDSVLSGNTLSANGDIGLIVRGANRSRVTRNQVVDHPEAGLVIEAAHTLETGNSVLRNGDGIVISGDDNVVTANIVVDALGCPDDGEFGCGFGISFEGGLRNLVGTNFVTRARRAALRVEAFSGTTSDNVIRANVLRDAGVDDLQVNMERAGAVNNTLLDRNIATGATDDGIDVQSASTVLSRNLAVRNGTLGVRAIAGVTDKGGKRAAYNGDSRQCLNVTC